MYLLYFRRVALFIDRIPQLTDICVKNGGDQFLTEVGSREFMDNLVSILRMESLNLDVKNMMLRLLQNWSVAFEGKPSLGYVAQVCRNLQNEGIYSHHSAFYVLILPFDDKVSNSLPKTLLQQARLW